MFLELDPGTKAAPALEEGDTIPVVNTAPDVNADEVLSALDDDTRDYLRLLLTGAGGGLERRGGDLREVFRRLGPLHRAPRRAERRSCKERRAQARAARPQLRRDVRGARDEGQGAVAPRRRLRARPSARSRRRTGTSPRRSRACPRRSRRRRRRCSRWTSSARSPAPRSRRCARPRASSSRRTTRSGRSPRRPCRSSATGCGRSSARRGPTSATCGRPRENLAHGEPRPARELLRAEPPLQHARLQPAAGTRSSTRAEPRAHNANRRATRASCSGSPGWPRTPPRSCRTGDAQGNFRRFTISASCSTLRGLVAGRARHGAPPRRHRRCSTTPASAPPS